MGIKKTQQFKRSKRLLNRDDFDRLRLARTARIGPVSYRQLLARFGSASAALAALPEIAGRNGGKFVAASEELVAREIETVEQLGAQYLFLDQLAYPAALAAAPASPVVLTYKGHLELCNRPALAIVGARNASAAARKMAQQWAGFLSAQGIVIISGLARGIDTHAHVGAVEHGTIAVIAGGIDVIYPPENAKLQEHISTQGLLIAEQPPGTEPKARFFPHRNRVIAGLAGATLVMEAAPKSGSLITARLAAEAGRDVMAVPGSPMDPRARGCNELIREGAVLVQTPEDVLEIMRPYGGQSNAVCTKTFIIQPSLPLHDPGDDERRRLFTLLGPVPVPVDELIRQSGMDHATVQLCLMELEVAGRIERSAGQKVRLTG